MLLVLLTLDVSIEYTILETTMYMGAISVLIIKKCSIYKRSLKRPTVVQLLLCN